MPRTSARIRSEFQYQPLGSAVPVGEIKRALSLWERLSNITVLRRALILIGFAVLWQLYASRLNSPLLFPTFGAVVDAFLNTMRSGELPAHVWNSLAVLVKGYAVGVVLAILLTTLAVSSRFGNDLLATLTGMFNPLPAIALLPIALLWFGLGDLSLIFVLIHAVMWPMVLNTHSGFLAVSSDAAHGRPQQRHLRTRLCYGHSHPCRVSFDSCRLENQLGVRLAYADCR